MSESWVDSSVISWSLRVTRALWRGSVKDRSLLVSMPFLKDWSWKVCLDVSLLSEIEIVKVCGSFGSSFGR